MLYDKRWEHPSEVAPPTPTNKPVEKWRLILRKAAAMFEGKARWIQGGFYGKERESYCAVGAINVAAGFRPAECPSTSDLRLVHAALAKQIGHARMGDARTIWHWNDASGRTREEVIAVLRAAAEQEI